MRYGDKIAKSSASVLITGESGSGKELIATASITTAALQRPLIKINWGRSEVARKRFFGHEKGPYRCVTRGAPFLSRLMANHILDEIGDISADFR